MTGNLMPEVIPVDRIRLRYRRIMRRMHTNGWFEFLFIVNIFIWVGVIVLWVNS